MVQASKCATLFVALAVLIAAGRVAVAQGTLAQLGLTETAARNFVLEEIKSTATNRRSDIAIAGTRAFLKLPRPARAAAATGLFAWAKAYVTSPAFQASYASYRNGRIPQGRQYALTVEEAVKKDIDEQLAGMEQLKKAAASMPPADAANILESVKKMHAMLTDPAFIKQRHAQLADERAAEGKNETAIAAEVEEMTPADARKLFARRLREFLDATAGVNFEARTISLTGGPDGIEFVDRPDRKRPWMWQQAAIVGPEATAAARASAEAWLKELER
ncbi:MAG TPA: hypothetical protein VES67_24515 [Vicinamibacterales bacterium]|nr:hypothetical protein [Vicinamibacterales bacterium]